jgi:hypothetical protein
MGGLEPKGTPEYDQSATSITTRRLRLLPGRRRRLKVTSRGGKMKTLSTRFSANETVFPAHRQSAEY